MKKMMFSLGFAALALGATAQVKIKDGSVTGSSTTPNSNAILELESNQRGLLYPRVALSSTSSASPLTAHLKGMVVYDTATVAANGITPGIYYNDGTQWVRITTTAVNNAALTENINGTGSTFTANSATDVDLGTIYAPTTAGTSGQVVMSNGSGAPSWGNIPGITSTILGNTPPAVINNLSADQYTGANITLPVGKWLVYMNIQVDNVASIPSGQSAWIRYTLSSSSSSESVTGFSFLQSQVISTNLTYTGNFGPCQGVLPINVTTAGTFYVWISATQGATSGLSLGGNPENYIFAIPIN